MRDRRPEKGPLYMSLAVSIFVLIFAIFWTVMATSMGMSGGIMAIFGIFFIGFAIARIVMTINHAQGKDRRPSFRDRTEDEVPENRYAKPQAPEPNQTAAQAYCPSCGAKVGADFTFCSECGRRLPDKNE